MTFGIDEARSNGHRPSLFSRQEDPHAQARRHCSDYFSVSCICFARKRLKNQDDRRPRHKREWRKRPHMCADHPERQRQSDSVEGLRGDQSLSLVVTFPLPAATDNADPDPTVVCAPPPGSSFPVGETLVTCVATDEWSNSASATFTVTVLCGDPKNDPTGKKAEKGKDCKGV